MHRPLTGQEGDACVAPMRDRLWRGRRDEPQGWVARHQRRKRRPAQKGRCQLGSAAWHAHGRLRQASLVVAFVFVLVLVLSPAPTTATAGQGEYGSYASDADQRTQQLAPRRGGGKRGVVVGILVVQGSTFLERRVVVRRRMVGVVTAQSIPASPHP